MCGRGALRSPFLPQRPLPPSCHPPSCPGTGLLSEGLLAPAARPGRAPPARPPGACTHATRALLTGEGGRRDGGSAFLSHAVPPGKATGRPVPSPCCWAGARGTRGRLGPRLGAGLRSPRGRARKSAPHRSAPVQGRRVEGKGRTGVRPATGQPGSYGRRAGYVFGG